MQNQLNCRGSNPHSHMTHQEGVVSLTPNILIIAASCQFYRWLSISLPCCKQGVAQIWLAYIPAGMFIFTWALVAYTRKAFKPRCCLHFQSMCMQAKPTDIVHYTFGQIKIMVPWHICHIYSGLVPSNQAAEYSAVCTYKLKKGWQTKNDTWPICCYAILRVHQL